MAFLNMRSNVQNIWPFPCADPDYIDLFMGLSYSFWLMNTTAADITAGVIELWGADADPTNWCLPDINDWEQLEPVAGCTGIVSGIAETGRVSVTITPDMPIRAHAVCGFAAPCPKQFFQVRNLPTGVHAIGIVSDLRRTNFDHYSHWGFIPHPMDVGIESMMARAPAQQIAAQPAPAPAPAPAPRAAQAAPAQAAPPARPRNPRPQPAR